MISARASRRPASAKELEAALGRLDQGPGGYFGCDAGVAGLHPLQATLLDEPDLTLRVYGDGLSVESGTGLGHALLQHVGLRDLIQRHARGHGQPPVAGLRAFLAAFEPLPEVLLMGAFRFDAWRLGAEPESDAGDCLGQLYFSTRYWQRDAQGCWHRIELALQGLTAVAHPRGSAKPPPRTSTVVLDDYPPGGYAGMVARALDFLREPTLVSLTLSQSFRRETTASPGAAFARLRQANPAPATFFFNDGKDECLFGASPDLQLVLTAGQVETLPVCGTVARGPGPVGEAESFRELVNEAVDAASLAVCTDALRNDLAPLCVPGTLRLLDRRRPLSLATVVHTVDRIAGRLRDGADAWDAIVATAAPVMVTGTPRRAALAAIEALEASPRGWYGGLMVQVRGNGDALAGTILRAATLRHGVAEVRTGGDLMADSTPAREEQESRLKALSLWRALGLEATEPSIETAPPSLPSRVALLDAGDAFPSALRDALAGLGMTVDSSADTAVLIGTDPQRCAALLAGRAPGPLVAIGDAACMLLARAGFQTVAQRPAHGRLLSCLPTSASPWAGGASFIAARYASSELADTALLPGWEAWLRDPDGRAVMLVHAERRLACLLHRPESMLSSNTALSGFRDTLAWISAPYPSTDYPEISE